MRLNEQQQKAVRHSRGPLLVAAGPGSGKTTVIVHRAARLLREEQLAPNRLLVVTFSRRAAQQMRRRMNRLLSGTCTRVTRRQFATIHSLGYQILLAHDRRPEVLDARRADRLLRHILAKRGLYDRRDPLTLRDLKSEISYVRSHGVELANIGRTYHPQVLGAAELRAVLREYQRHKEERGVRDFADLLEDAQQLIRDDAAARRSIQNRVEQVMLDEAQDTSPLQFALIMEVAAPQNNLMVVGDDDQSIYSFRGADPRLLLRFPDAFDGAPVVRMTANYRSGAELVRRSAQLIAHNRQRFRKSLRAAAARETTIHLRQPRDPAAQAESVVAAAAECGAFRQSGQMAALYRTNLAALPLLDALVRGGHPFRLLSSAGAGILRHPVLRDMLAFLRLAAAPDEPRTSDVLRLVNRPTRYIPHRILQQLAAQLPPTGGDVWRSLLGHPELSERQRGEVGQLHRGLLDYHEEGKKTEAEQLDDFLGRSPFDYDVHLRAQSADPERVGAYRRQFRSFQLLAHEGLQSRIAALRRGAGRAAERGDDDPGLVLSTCHTAKGLEWPHVQIIDAVDGVMPPAAARVRDGMTDEEEERRLFYVAMTRAVESLTVSIPETGVDGPVRPSPFALECGLLAEDEPRARTARRGRSRPARKKTRRRSETASRSAESDTPRVSDPIADASALRPGRKLVHASFGPITVRRIEEADNTVHIRTESGEDKALHIPACVKRGLVGYPPR